MSPYQPIIEALTPLVKVLEQLGITYYIGGSVSSSVHGTYRQTQDIDVIVDLKQSKQVHQITRILKQEYYIDEEAFEDALQHNILYGILHLDTMIKIDLIPFKKRAFAQEEARRA